MQILIGGNTMTFSINNNFPVNINFIMYRGHRSETRKRNVEERGTVRSSPRNGACKSTYASLNVLIVPYHTA